MNHYKKVNGYFVRIEKPEPGMKLYERKPLNFLGRLLAALPWISIILSWIGLTILIVYNLLLYLQGKLPIIIEILE